MKKVIFTPRHRKLIELKENVDLLLLGQKNQDYIKHLRYIREQTVEQLRAEEARSRIKSL